jgi:hypothetical protein
MARRPFVAVPFVLAALILAGTANSGETGTAPVVTVPADFTWPATGPDGAEVTFVATAADEFGESLDPVCSPPSGSTFPIGPTNVTCTATDAAGNTGSASFTVTVTVQDVNAPTVTISITTPQPAEATGPDGAPVSYTASAVDDVDGDVSSNVTCSPGSGSTFALGATTVTCNITDSAGNPGNAAAEVRVADTTAPHISAPDNLTVQPTSSAGATVTYDASATDLVSGSVSVECSPPSGALFPRGLSTVTCTATDGSGNSASTTFSVSVQDADAPKVNVPASKRVEANGPSGARAFFDPVTATDMIDGNLIASCDKQSGAIFPLGITTIVCSATDRDGNTGSASFTITVEDTTPPVLNAPSLLEVTSGSAVPRADPRIAAFLASATASDLVDRAVHITNNAPEVFPFGSTTVTFRADDDAGNRAEEDATVVITTRPTEQAVIDATPPPNPPNVSGTLGNLAVILRWGKVRTKDFHHFEVWRTPGRDATGRSLAGAAPESMVYRGVKRTFTDRSLKKGVEYRYVVSAVDTTGNRSLGAVVVALAEEQTLLAPLNGSTVFRPPLVRWKRMNGTRYWNTQLWRNGVKILSVWPTAPRYQLRARWVFDGKRYRLTPGHYLIYVWPGIGEKTAGRYGELHVEGEFDVRKR